MDTILGFLGLVVWIAGTIGIAAGISYVVIKLFPGGDDVKPKTES
jgi:hypothetical protein